jgi:hypothetical protein
MHVVVALLLGSFNPPHPSRRGHLFFMYAPLTSSRVVREGNHVMVPGCSVMDN